MKIGDRIGSESRINPTSFQNDLAAPASQSVTAAPLTQRAADVGHGGPPDTKPSPLNKAFVPDQVKKAGSSFAKLGGIFMPAEQFALRKHIYYAFKGGGEPEAQTIYEEFQNAVRQGERTWKELLAAFNASHARAIAKSGADTSETKEVLRDLQRALIAGRPTPGAELPPAPSVDPFAPVRLDASILSLAEMPAEQRKLRQHLLAEFPNNVAAAEIIYERLQRAVWEREATWPQLYRAFEKLAARAMEVPGTTLGPSDALSDLSEALRVGRDLGSL